MILKELTKLLETKVKDDRYFITYPVGKSIDLYVETAFPSYEAADRKLTKLKDRLDSGDADLVDVEEEQDLLDSCEILSGEELKKQYPKLFEATTNIKSSPRGRGQLGDIITLQDSDDVENLANMLQLSGDWSLTKIRVGLWAAYAAGDRLSFFNNEDDFVADDEGNFVPSEY